jgi:hypothetical protein
MTIIIEAETYPTATAGVSLSLFDKVTCFTFSDKTFFIHKQKTLTSSSGNPESTV